ncbi:MAG: hypothetical protein A2189_04155 [Paenibacillus sp. RIFOXYA1_FULL_44_5]|nr:MAG: hypothetical protein A2189_04155 [Paenibacillus sp. RIFOXYA1_FULL_44_5]
MSVGFANPHIYQLAASNRHHLGQGVRIKRFRKPNKWHIENRILMAVLFVENIKLSQLAKQIGVSPRTVGAWVYEGRLPNQLNQEKTAQILGLPVHILFAENQGNPELEAQGESKFLWRVLNSPVQNRILTGMFIVHDLSPADVSRWIGMNPGTMRKYLHAGKLPSAEFRKKISDFFQMPESLLFAECIFQEL